MQLNNIMKVLVIAIPMVTMVACKSGPTDAELEAERNREAQAQQQAAAEAQAAEEARVKVEAAARASRAAEIVEQEKQALINDQTVYFEFDRSSVKAEFYPILDKHAAFLVKNPNQTVVIEGHCDSRGTPEYNIALGERRAQSVETYLRNQGVSSSQISVVSYGEEKPVVSGATEYAFAQNRRGIVRYN